MYEVGGLGTIICLYPLIPRTRSPAPETFVLALESMGKADNATSDVAVEGDGNIYIDEGLVFRLDTVTPDCDDDM